MNTVKKARRNLLPRENLARCIREGQWECQTVYGEWVPVFVAGDDRASNGCVLLSPFDFDSRGKHGFAEIHEDGSVTLSVSDTRKFLLRDMMRPRAFVFEVRTTAQYLNGNIDEFIARSVEEAEAKAAEHYRRVFVGTGHTVTWRLVSESHMRIDGRRAA
jgi:hypothetical protein